MPAFGTSSKRRLVTCHAILQELMYRVVERRDCFVACGHRGEEAQMVAFEARPQLSKVAWPDSNHNKTPSMAVDTCPWPEQWDSEAAFVELSEIVKDEWAKMVAEGVTQDYDLRWGGDWDGDGNVDENDSWDKPHWELVR